MSYNNGFPTSQVYQPIQPVQPIQQVGYTQYNQQLNNQQLVQQMPQQTQQFNQIIDDRIRVQGIENAKLYPIAPNSTTILWDVDDKTFYKITAGSPIKVYEYFEQGQNIDVENNIEEIQQDFDLDEYVKIDDIEDIVNQIVEEKLKNKTNNEIIKPQNDVQEVKPKPSRTMTRKKGDK